jgi:hypothetical protein
MIRGARDLNLEDSFIHWIPVNRKIDSFCGVWENIQEDGGILASFGLLAMKDGWNWASGSESVEKGLFY